MLLVGATLAIRGLARCSGRARVRPAQRAAVGVSLRPGRFRLARRSASSGPRSSAASPRSPGSSRSRSTGAPNFAARTETSYAPGGEPAGDTRDGAVAYASDAGFIETMKIPLLAGRTFGPQDTYGDPPVLIIDEDLADRFFPGQDPIGQHLQDVLSDKPSVEIVGVVGHVKHYGPTPRRRAVPDLLRRTRSCPRTSQPTRSLGNMTWSRAPRGEPQDLAAQVRAAVAGDRPGAADLHHHDRERPWTARPAPLRRSRAARRVRRPRPRCSPRSACTR
jgi:hypothetical protein